LRTAEHAALRLTQGLLEASAWPEFEDEDFLAEVRKRLEGVGLELASADGYWLARSRDTGPDEGFKPLFRLDQAELAVLAALYLHIRFLPRQGEQLARRKDHASVLLEDIERGFPAYTVDTIRRVLGRLRNLHFVRQYQGRLYAGPYLTALDELVADERAREALRDFKLRSQLSRKLAELQERIGAAD
jgi:hypothetical protein